MSLHDQNQSRANGRLSGSGASKVEGADAIRSRMAEVRSELRRDVDRLAHDVQQATDWKRYLRKYPYVVLGVAAVVGYSLVPARKREAVVATDEQIRELADAGKLHIISDPAPPQIAGMTQKVALALGTMAARAAMSYIGKELGPKADTANPDPTA